MLPPSIDRRSIANALIGAARASRWIRRFDQRRLRAPAVLP